MVRVGLVNEGTYPYVTGGVSTWCDQLVRGLSEVDWQLVTVTGAMPGVPAWQLPPNVRSLTPVPIWGPQLPDRYRPVLAAAQICRGMLGDTPADRAQFASGLRGLAVGGTPGRHPLVRVPLADLLLDAWGVAGKLGARLPRLTLYEAGEAAMLLEHAIRPVTAVLPTADVWHANANGLSSLVALAAKWRHGKPFVMTEHGVYLRERYLASADQPPGVKAALLRFHRALAQLAYRQADLIAPVSGFNRRWEIRHGADPARIRVVPNGVDPARFPLLPTEPEAPVIAWVGRVDPLKDLETLIRALHVARQTVPAARLHLAGPVPAGNEEYAQRCKRIAADLGLAEAVTFAGPVSHSRDAFATGQIAALSSISEGMPYTVIEAMMCGRATVSTDVGGVAETVDDTGLVVPPGSPEMFGAACAALLSDPERRIDLATRGRQRALERYTLNRCLDSYRDLYEHAVGRVAA